MRSKKYKLCRDDIMLIILCFYGPRSKKDNYRAAAAAAAVRRCNNCMHTDVL